MHLLAADRARFGRRRDLQLLVLLVPVILLAIFVNEFNSVTTQPTADFFIDPPDPVLEAQLRDQQLAEWRQQLVVDLPQYAFPASLVKVAGNVAPLVLLAIYLATALVAGEFEWGTVRTIHLTSSRSRTMATRIALVAGLVALATAIALVLASVIPFLLSFEGHSLQSYATPVPDLAAQVGVRLVTVLPFVTIPAMMSVLARSTGLGFLFTLLFFAADIALTGAPIWPNGPLSWVPAATISGSIARLLGTDDSFLASLAPAWVSVVALVGWALVPALAAVARFRTMDLNE